MTRLLAELDRLDAGHPRPRYASRLPGDRKRRLTAVATAAVVALAVGGTFAHKQFGLTVTAEGVHLASPLGRPPAMVPHSGSYAFMQTQPGSTEPVGTTDDEPGRRPTDRIARAQPALIAWSEPTTVPGLTGRVAGLGGSVAVSDEYTGRMRYVTGTVTLDAPQLTRVLHRPGGPVQVRAIILHELGHLVGLDHVDDPGELMYKDNVGSLDLGPGDREGLAALGAGRCFH
jgi:hypothetical protein